MKDDILKWLQLRHKWGFTLEMICKGLNLVEDGRAQEMLYQLIDSGDVIFTHINGLQLWQARKEYLSPCHLCGLPTPPRHNPCLKCKYKVRRRAYARNYYRKHKGKLQAQRNGTP